jgi:hypothetical protein
MRPTRGAGKRSLRVGVTGNFDCGAVTDSITAMAELPETAQDRGEEAAEWDGAVTDDWQICCKALHEL